MKLKVKLELKLKVEVEVEIILELEVEVQHCNLITLFSKSQISVMKSDTGYKITLQNIHKKKLKKNSRLYLTT